MPNKPQNTREPLPGTTRNHELRILGTVCPFRDTGPIRVRNVPFAASLGLTGGQQLTFAIVGLAFVVLVWLMPLLSKWNHQPRNVDKAESHRRLMSELRHHRER